MLVREGLDRLDEADGGEAGGIEGFVVAAAQEPVGPEDQLAVEIGLVAVAVSAAAWWAEPNRPCSSES